MDRVIIVTFGLKIIVKALLHGSLWQSAQLIATPLIGAPAFLRQGKLEILSKQFDERFIASATFITDSLDDIDLLNATQNGLLVERQGNIYMASDRLYLPLKYTLSAKYPFSYVLDQVILVELLLAIICTVTSFETLFAELAFVPFLFLSLICVYELGYFENDMVAAKRETAPTLSDEVERFRSYPIFPSAWLWSAALFAVGISIGCFLGSLSWSHPAFYTACWFSALIFLRLLFYVYNTANVSYRTLLYPALQLMKFLPMYVIIKPTLLGAALTISQITVMWLTYLIYRLAGKKRVFNKEIYRTIFFGLSLVLFLLAGATNEWFSLFVILIWSVARLVKAPILNILRNKSFAHQE